MKFDDTYKRLMDEYISNDEYGDILMGDDNRDISIKNLKDVDIDTIINKMVVPKRSKDSMKLVLVDTDKFDKMWRESDPDFYIGQGGVGGIKNRYKNFIAFLMIEPEQREENYGPVMASEVSVSNNKIIFTNGRHRFSVLRDVGVKKIPVAMNKNSIDNAKKIGIV